MPCSMEAEQGNLPDCKRSCADVIEAAKYPRQSMMTAGQRKKWF